MCNGSLSISEARRGDPGASRSAGREDLSKTLQRARRCALHGAHGAAEDSGRLRLGEALEVAEHQGGALARGQYAERVDQLGGGLHDPERQRRGFVATILHWRTVPGVQLGTVAVPSTGAVEGQVDQ